MRSPATNIAVPQPIWIRYATACVWLLCAAILLAAEQRPPNVVFILADDVGREVLGCYGGTSYQTPNLDALAAEGLRFQHCYSMPVCHPTRICLLTGRYPLRLGNPTWGEFPQTEEQVSLGNVMKKAGYATAIAGKWQLALLKQNPRHPRQLGFDNYCLFGWHEGPRYYQPLIWQNGKLRDDVADRYGPDVYCDFLVDFMQQHREVPFFAFYSMALCHDVTDDLPDPAPLGPRGRYDSYREMAEAMDERVGRVVTAIDRLDLRANTLVLFTADNGSPRQYITTAEGKKLIREPVISNFNGNPLRGGKGTLADAGTRVPTIARWPGTIQPDQVVDDLVDFSDFLPTFAALASTSLPNAEKLDGQSFAPRLQTGQPAARRWAFAQRGNRFFVRTRQWKLYSDGALYDMVADNLEEQPHDRSQPANNAQQQWRLLDAAVKQIRSTAAR